MLHENLNLILKACSLRKPLIDDNPQGAYRLFTGFREGFSHLVIELFNTTLVFYDYSPEGDLPTESLKELAKKLLDIYPGIIASIRKVRNSAQPELRQGVILLGDKPTRWIKEQGVRYAVDLQMNQDTSFYLDTRNLRNWLNENSKDKVVLNTFAYTGSLGVAAFAGQAKQVIQTDLNRTFLNLAKTSCALNGLPVNKSDYIAYDFFKVTTRLKKDKRLFDTVILDPPFFSDTAAGRVDIMNEYTRLVNKVRPLVAHNGMLITINNAIFLSGMKFIETLDELCQSEYLSLEKCIPVPQDCVGYTHSITDQPLVDPSPFNHSTKIALLRVTRKDQQSA
jgi:23S rRNA (cytosine1962-C5)-methyltransferase